MTLRDLKTDQYFRFIGSPHVWQYRGNGWYASPGGYDGGPWFKHETTPVELYECPGCGENDCPGCQPTGQNLACFIGGVEL